MEVTEKKYLDALNDLYSVLKYTDSLSLTRFMTDNGLSKNFAIVIKKGGLISTNGLKSKGAKYKWETIKPNIKMAKEVVDRINKVGNTAMKKTRGGKREGSGRKPKSIENRYLESYTTSLLWGLIKIKTKLNYKISK